MVRPLWYFMYAFPKLIKFCLLDLKSLSNDLLCFVVILCFYFRLFKRDISCISKNIGQFRRCSVNICMSVLLRKWSICNCNALEDNAS